MSTTSVSKSLTGSDQFVEGGKRALSGKLGNPNEELRRKLSEYEKVIGRLTVQNEILKKTFSE